MSDAQSHLTRRIIIFVCALFFLVLGYWGGWCPLAEGWASTSWPESIGSVTMSEVVVGSRGAAHGKLEYAYEVDDTSFTSSGTCEALVSQTGSLLPEYEAEYQVGDTVNVYYNPGNPAQSVLKRGATVKSYIVLLLAIGMGGLMVVLGFLKPPH